MLSSASAQEHAIVRARRCRPAAVSSAIGITEKKKGLRAACACDHDSWTIGESGTQLDGRRRLLLRSQYCAHSSYSSVTSVSKVAQAVRTGLRGRALADQLARRPRRRAVMPRQFLTRVAVGVHAASTRGARPRRCGYHRGATPPATRPAPVLAASSTADHDAQARRLRVEHVGRVAPCHAVAGVDPQSRARSRTARRDDPPRSSMSSASRTPPACGRLERQPCVTRPRPHGAWPESSAHKEPYRTASRARSTAVSLAARPGSATRARRAARRDRRWRGLRARRSRRRSRIALHRPASASFRSIAASMTVRRLRPGAPRVSAAAHIGAPALLSPRARRDRWASAARPSRPRRPRLHDEREIRAAAATPRAHRLERCRGLAATPGASPCVIGRPRELESHAPSRTSSAWAIERSGSDSAHPTARPPPAARAPAGSASPAPAPASRPRWRTCARRLGITLGEPRRRVRPTAPA